MKAFHAFGMALKSHDLAACKIACGVLVNSFPFKMRLANQRAEIREVRSHAAGQAFADDRNGIVRME